MGGTPMPPPATARNPGSCYDHCRNEMKKHPNPLANTASLTTVGAWLRFAEKLYAREKLALGQVATNAHDEALYLLLRTLDLPLDSDAGVLAKKLTAAERAKSEERRV